MLEPSENVGEAQDTAIRPNRQPVQQPLENGVEEQGTAIEPNQEQLPQQLENGGELPETINGPIVQPRLESTENGDEQPGNVFESRQDPVEQPPESDGDGETAELPSPEAVAANQATFDEPTEPDASVGSTSFERAMAFFQAGDYEIAIAEFNSAVASLRPNLAMAYFTRGSALWRQGEYAAALVDFTQTLDLEPNNAQALFHRGITHAKMNNLPAALADLNESVRLDPQRAQVYVNRAIVFNQAGQQQDALDDYARAAELDPRYAIHYCNQRAHLHLLEGRLAWAAADFAVVLYMDPKNVVAQEGRKRALLELKYRPQPVRALAPQPRPSQPRSKSTVSVNGQTQRHALPSESSNPELEPVEDANETLPVCAEDTEAGAPYPLETVAEAPKPKKSPKPSTAKTHKSREEKEADDYLREQAFVEAQKAASAERLAQLKAAEEEKQKRERAKAEAERARRAAREDDDRGFLERYQKPLLGLAAAFLLSVIGYYAWGFFQSHKKSDAPLAADAVWQEYRDDPAAANKKYANQRYFMVGKLVISPSGPRGPREVCFQAPGDGPLKIHCSFVAVNELAEVANGATPGSYLISGEFQPYHEGPIVEFGKCEFIGASGPAPGGSGVDTSQATHSREGKGDLAEQEQGIGIMAARISHEVRAGFTKRTYETNKKGDTRRVTERSARAFYLPAARSFACHALA
jgi:tetratricopeptide (TPR) repeat protein